MVLPQGLEDTSKVKVSRMREGAGKISSFITLPGKELGSNTITTERGKRESKRMEERERG